MDFSDGSRSSLSASDDFRCACPPVEPALPADAHGLCLSAPQCRQRTMQPAVVVAALAALLASDGTVLDCVCSHLRDVTGSASIWGASAGERYIWLHYCEYPEWFPVAVACGAPERPPAADSPVERLTARLWDYGPPPPPPAGGRQGGRAGCAAALAELRRLAWDEAWQLVQQLDCRIADGCVDSCPEPRLNNMEWNMTTLQTDDLRHILCQSLQAVRRITRATVGRMRCESWRLPDSEWMYKTVFQERLSSYWRDVAQLLSLSATHYSQLLVPLALEDMGSHTSGQQLHGWTKDVERVKDMLHTKLTGLVHDAQYISKQVEHYEMEEDKDRPGRLILRRPLLSERLLRYQPWNLSFPDDFSALCEERQPQASQMFSLAASLYAAYRVYWYAATEFIDLLYEDEFKTVDEEWQLEDRSSATLSVDTDCVQLLANALDHPTCPLEDLPLEALKQREQCRVQLWDDVVQRSPHIPVTSYLAYTQRVNVNLCLLAWMAVNSYSICEGVPFSIIQSLLDITRVTQRKLLRTTLCVTHAPAVKFGTVTSIARALQIWGQQSVQPPEAGRDNQPASGEANEPELMAECEGSQMGRSEYGSSCFRYATTFHKPN
ncbi:uncharacterized protein LOC126295010 [Schistocerca gregaria]|uniref:uncharacterized protein LOC126295010 n=1 Tax=Schistocerca gregaria TaxID=7010 RepID=UPI00211E1C6C|nr:uncharacterized protein LOC126295010 [Schistocerca gregaria]